jgi:twitching motility protein PilT
VTTVHSEVIDPWLQVLFERGGTDLLLTASSPPRIRVDGALRPIENEPYLSAERVEGLVQGLLSPELLARFVAEKDVDFSFSWRDLARLRGNAFLQKGNTTLSLRMIPSRIPNFAELGLPSAATWLANLPRGLVLVTGPTGSGKSTTLASIIDHINDHRALHILTVEDPIEYVHEHKKSAVNQREVGIDSDSFGRALRAALREDPDVLLIGEMRDLESIQMALTMAETGHLVFATLHTNDASQALDRIIDVFPAERQDQIRVQLASSLAVVVAQRLVPRIDGGMIAAFEVLIANSPTRNLIREGKTNQLRNVMTTNLQEGMRTLEMHLSELIQAGVISHESALTVSVYPKELARSLAAAKFQAVR